MMSRGASGHFSFVGVPLSSLSSSLSYLSPSTIFNERWCIERERNRAYLNEKQYEKEKKYIQLWNNQMDNEDSENYNNNNSNANDEYSSDKSRFQSCRVSSISVVKVISHSSLVLLENGDIVDLNHYENAVLSQFQATFDELNSSDVHVIDMVMGGTSLQPFFVALTADGDVLLCGYTHHLKSPLIVNKNKHSNEHDDIKPVLVPYKLDKFSSSAAPIGNIAVHQRSPLSTHIVAISAGTAHVLLLDKNHVLYSFGNNQHGQCARKQDGPMIVPHPHSVSALHNTTLVRIHAAFHMSYAIDNTGKLYAWGYGVGHASLQPHPLQFYSNVNNSYLPNDNVHIKQVVAGHSHMLALSNTGHVYSMGLNSNGQLGIENVKKLTVPVLLKTQCDGHIQHIDAGDFTSSFIDSSGNVYVFGSNQHQKLSSSINSDITVPTHLKFPGPVSQLSLQKDRTIAFIPLRLTHATPHCISAHGDTVLTLRGNGFDFPHTSPTVTFQYRGATCDVQGAWDPITDTISAKVPSIAYLGVDNHHGTPEHCLVRVGSSPQHLSNAIALSTFSTPQSDGAKLIPNNSPYNGGGQLKIRCNFDAVPYTNVSVQFKTEDGLIIGVVAATYDANASCFHCTIPTLSKSLISSFNDRDVTSIQAIVSLALDSQQYWTFPQRFLYHNVTTFSSTPSTCGYAGCDLTMLCNGVHVTSSMFVKFIVHPTLPAPIVPARFVSLQQFRGDARRKRDLDARIGRKQKADAAAAELARLAQIAAEEEENRDPKEKERLAKEKARAEKLEHKEEHMSPSRSTVHSSRSRPRSSQGKDVKEEEKKGNISSRVTSRATTPGLPEALADDHAQFTSSSSLSPGADDASLAPSASPSRPLTAASPSPPTHDEWDDIEDAVVAREREEDAEFSRYSEIDRAAIGYVMCTTPIFTQFGSCTPTIAISLNGQDYVNVSAPLHVLPPEPVRVQPTCGPVSGGTELRIVGDNFYYAPTIHTMLIPPVIDTTQTRPASAHEENHKRASTKESVAANNKKPTKGGKDAAPVEVAAPPVIIPSQTITSTYEALSATQGGVRLFTPVWPGAQTVSLSVGFQPAENAFSTRHVAFTYYEPFTVVALDPVTISQTGGTEVSISGRGFIPSDSIKVRLTLPDVEEETRGKKHTSTSHHSPAPASSTLAADDKDGTASPAATSVHATPRTGRSIKTTLKAPPPEPIDTARAAEIAKQKRLNFPTLIVDGVYHSNEDGDEDPKKKKKLSKKEEGELEPATITFVTPPGTAFNSDFWDGSSSMRAVEVELALNGQQYVSIPILLRFEKENKTIKKLVDKKKAESKLNEKQAHAHK